MSKKLTPAVGYIRMSSGKQEASPAQQRAEIIKLAKRERKAVKLMHKAIAAVGDESVTREANVFYSPDSGRLCFGYDGGAHWAFSYTAYSNTADERWEALAVELRKLNFDPQHRDPVTMELFDD